MKNNLRSSRCRNCASENPRDAKFCQSCGQPLTFVCTECGAQNEIDAKFCKNCGTPLELISRATDKAQLASLRQAAPQVLQEKIRASSPQIEGERKPVTILFTDIVGSTTITERLDPEEWKEIVSGAHRLVSDAIYHYEGTIAQLLGDGVLAFFGAPITHEDDPIRAVHAALDIQDSVVEYERELVGMVDEFKMRVGINTGTVVIGEIGADLHVEYLAIGDAVNVAARLQSAAKPGKVLLSDDCARLVTAAFELKDLDKIDVKGKSEPISVFEVVSAKIAPESGRGIEGLTSPLVGRERELNELLSTLASLRKGHGQIFTLLGEAGIGKSRLLEEAKELVEKEPVDESVSGPPLMVRWLEGRSLSYGSTLSFWPITQLLLADLDLSEGEPEARIKVALRKRVMGLFGDEYSEALPFLSHLLGLQQEQYAKERILQLDGETLKRQILLFTSEYFARIADERPTVLIFEDMHWADPSSLETLDHLLALTNRVPLMILMVMRIDRDHGSWSAKVKAETDYAHRYKDVHLKRLSSTESDQLVNHLLEIADLPESLRSLILARSEGNPFYLEEIVRNLIDHGIILQEDHTWRVMKEISEISIPSTLHGILLARIDRLEEDVRRTLQLASVIGKSFLYRLLEAIAEAELQLDQHLSQLQRADLVREKSRWPEMEYIFKHSLTQEAAYNSLLVERRRAFHIKVGEAIEELFADRREEFYGLLAHHFEVAEIVEKAVDYLLLAGDKARLEEAFKEAKDYYHRAIKLLSKMKDEEREARTWLKLGLIAMVSFDFEGAHIANEKAFSLDQLARAKQIIRPEEELTDPRMLKMIVRGSPDTLDPGKAVWSYEMQIIQELFAGLAQFDSEVNVVPYVARSWEVIDGGKRYLFHLREDVLWTDGRPVTAEDFAWAWIRNLSLGAEVYLPGQMDEIIGARAFRLGHSRDPKSVGIRALDPLTLEVRLSTPVSYFIYLVTTPTTFPLPRSVIERYGDNWWKPEHIVSNGAFNLIRCDDVTFVLERNPDYFGDFRGNVDVFELQHSRDTKANIEDYIEGKADILWGESMKLIPSEVPVDEFHREPYFLYLNYVGFDPTRPPLDDFRVRRALAHTLDCRRVLESFSGPGAPPADGGVIPVGMAGHSPGIGLEYDVELGRRYLADAGYPDGKGFPPLIISITHGMELPAAEMELQWREALGIEITFQRTTITLDPSQVPDVQGICMSWAADYPDPDNFLRQSAVYNNLRNWGWKDARYDEFVETAARTPDRARRLEMYRQADRLLVAQEALIIPVGYGNVRGSADLVKPWVKNWRRNSLTHARFKDFKIERG